MDVAQVEVASYMKPITGYSLKPFLQNETTNWPRKSMVMAKERHDIGRPHDWGYPIRSILRDSLLYIYNFEPSRWPQGNPETGYLNCDSSPTKSWLISHYGFPILKEFWKMNLGKRPVEELYDLRTDPDCIQNLATEPSMGLIKLSLQQELVATLTAQGDRRMFGRGHEYEAYPYSGKRKDFYKRYMKNENPPFPGWVIPTDFHEIESP